MATTTASNANFSDALMSPENDEDLLMTTEGEDDINEDDDFMMMQEFMEDGDNMVDPLTEMAINTIAGTARQVSDSTHGTSTSAVVSSAAVAAAGSAVSHTDLPILTGRPSIPLYLSCNPDYLSEYQCLIRKNVELFEATEHDVNSRIKGRNKPIVMGQVGIRCRFCSRVYPVESRERGSTYYPHTLVGIYQAAQILSQQHLLETCTYVPENVRKELCELKNKKSFKTAGKEYWAQTAKVLGVYEDQHGLRFEKRLGIVRSLNPH